MNIHLAEFVRPILLGVSVSLALALRAENYVITEFSEKADDAVVVNPGDTLSLPEGGTYHVNNKRVASLGVDGRTVTILEPGILGVSKMTDTSVDATLAVVSLPENHGGRVFLFREGHWNRGQWSDPSTWRQVPSGGNDYPHLPGDIAMIIRFGDGWGMEVNVDKDISLGQLYYGSFRDFSDNQEAYSFKLRGVGGGSTTCLTFSNPDAGPALLRLCPNLLADGHKTFFKFGDTGYPLAVSCASDVDVDFGWDGVSSQLNLGFLQFTEQSSLDVASGKTLCFCNAAPHESGNVHSDIQLKGEVSGSGTIANAGRENMLCDFSDAGAFSGRIVDLAEKHDGFDRDATTFFRDCQTLTQAVLEVRGYVKRTNYKVFEPKDGAGYVRIGFSHSSTEQREVSNRLPGQALVLKGGRASFLDEQTRWSEGAVNTYATETLDVASGFSILEVLGNDNASYPPTYFSAMDLQHDDVGTVAVRCNRLWATYGSDRVDCHLPGFEDFAIGGIVPWLTAWFDHSDYGQAGGWESLAFPTLDGAGCLAVSPMVTSLSDADPESNVRLSGADLKITADKTINSLIVNNQWNGSKKIGEDKTLTIASGGLILLTKTHIGENEWNETTPSYKCGTLAFGGTAYVWANCPESDNPAWIMSTVLAPDGFVSAMPGYLTLCSDQRGIDGELVVNAGQLTLGLEADCNNVHLVLPCVLDVPVRIVGGESKIVLAAGTQLPEDQEVQFEDVGGYAGKLEIPSGSTQTCLKLRVDGTALPRGTYGATGSGAENIDDDHFCGQGVLVVRKDDNKAGLVIILR